MIPETNKLEVFYSPVNDKQTLTEISRYVNLGGLIRDDAARSGTGPEAERPPSSDTRGIVGAEVIWACAITRSQISMKRAISISCNAR